MTPSSRLIEQAVDQMASLPGIGRKSALRLVLHLLKQSPDEVAAFSNAFIEMRNHIRYCKHCHNIADADLCTICNNPRRDESLLCIVEDMRDIMAIEATQQYQGLYHVLGGIISPMNGIGPHDLNIPGLLRRLDEGGIAEVILALAPTMEGDTTCFYLFRKFQPYSILVSTLARGMAIGDAIEYTDEITLGRSIAHRTPYENLAT